MKGSPLANVILMIFVFCLGCSDSFEISKFSNLQPNWEQFITTNSTNNTNDTASIATPVQVKNTTLASSENNTKDHDDSNKIINTLQTDKPSKPSNEISAGDLQKIESKIKENVMQKVQEELKNKLKSLSDLKKMLALLRDLSITYNGERAQELKIYKVVRKMRCIYKSLNKTIVSEGNDIKSKLFIINKRFSAQLKLELQNQKINIESEIAKVTSQIQLLNTKLHEITMKIPNANSKCAKYPSCGSCTQDNGCVWCGLTKHCTEGGKNGPNDGSCTFFDYQVCSGPISCSEYKDCHGCIQNVECGWCNRIGKTLCMHKNQAEAGGCKKEVFIHLWKSLNQCPFVAIVYKV